MRFGRRVTCLTARDALAEIALEIGIEPTVRHVTDLGYIPIVVRDACGYGDEAAAARAFAGFAFTGEPIVTDVATITRHMERSL